MSRGARRAVEVEKGRVGIGDLAIEGGSVGHKEEGEERESFARDA